MIRKAAEKDMPRILEIYAAARQYMKDTGNPTQWGDNHPAESLLHEDIALGRLYADEIDGRVQGVFALVFGADATYAHIEDGAWLNDEPYATMHRVASGGEVKGVFARFCEFAKGQSDNVRIDTHYDNATMQHCIEKQGFTPCGRIYVEDGSPRKAYQWCREKE